jgi:uncharacterized peroxidase-related enzyme
MTYIKTIPYQAADSQLKEIYDRVKGPDDNVDNVLRIHSLRPHTLIGHMTLYKAVLHSANNTLSKWYLELIGVFVSQLNHCEYCVKHHCEGLKRQLNDDEKFQRFLSWINAKESNRPDFLSEKEFAGLLHAEKLTLKHFDISKADIDNLRKVGFSDGEILEINQVACYFNYVNRLVVGLGVSLSGDILGLSPIDSENPGNWEHK